jgi:hypothetical protein
MSDTYKNPTCTWDLSPLWSPRPPALDCCGALNILFPTFMTTWEPQQKTAFENRSLVDGIRLRGRLWVLAPMTGVIMRRGDDRDTGKILS